MRRYRSLEVIPSPRPGWAAISLPAEPEPIRIALLLEEKLEHAFPWQPLGQRGGLLLRARIPQAVQQPDHGARVIEGGVLSGATRQHGDLLLRARIPQETQ